MLRHELLDLRGLLGHLLSPPDPVSRSLEQSLDVAVRTLVPRGTRHQVEVRCPTLTAEENRVVYRVVREGVSNAVRHASAHAIRVAVCADPGPSGALRRVDVVVEDDGTGPGPGSRSGAEADGHFGLALLAGLVRDHGGTLSLEARHDGPGSRLTATLPLSGVPGSADSSPARGRGRRTRQTRTDPGTPGTTGVEGRAPHGSGVGTPHPDAAESAPTTL